MSTDKTLFKMWVEKRQLEHFKAIAKREKVSVAWLMRKAFDNFLMEHKRGH
jgi:hypothetical protein